LTVIYYVRRFGEDVTSPSRRRFLGGSALTIAALTGSVAAGTNPRERPAGRGESSSSPAEAIAALPPADAVERTYRTVVVETVDVDSADELTPTARSTAEALDVDPTALSTIASVFTTDYDRRLGTANGSFDALTDDDAAAAVDDWQVDDDGALAVASTDGHAAFAGGEDEPARVDTATTMAEVAVGDAPRFGEETVGVATASDALDSMQTVLFVPDPSNAGISNTASGKLRALAAGFSVHPSELTGSGEAEYYLFPTADATLDEDLVHAIVADVEPNEVVDADVSTVDDAIRVQATVEAAPDYDREAAPDARVRTSFDRETTTMTFEHRGGEAVPADELELWVDGELADTQPADRGDVFTEGDTLTVDTDPLAVVGLRWFDESANVYYTYASETVDREAFEATADPDAGTATIRYVGQHDADPSKLAVRHHQDGGVRAIEDAFTDAGETLTDGDEVVVEDVSFGDSVRVELAVPDVTGLHTRPLAHVRVSPPRLHIATHPERGTVLRYHGSTERDADEFRLLVDGEPADTQLAEKTETLSRGDTVAVGEFPLGSELTVEWVEPEESMVVAEHVVTPRTHVSVTYDPDDGTATFTHREGQSLPAEDLEVRVDRKATETQPSDEFDTFGSGDAFAVDVPPFASVKLVWIGEDVESRIGGTTTGRDAIEASYDPDAEELELVYVGEQPADPTRLHVRGHGSGGGEDEDTGAFAAAYGELTEGDSVTVDAGVDDRVALTVRTETENATSVRSIAHFSMTPRHAFRFERDDNSLIATYRDAVDRDADEFRVLVDGEPVDRQPGDVHDTLSRETTIDLGDVSAGKTVTVEWTAVDDAVEVGEHTVAPSAAFDVSYDAAEDALTVEHAGGETIDAANLSIVAPPSVERPADWTGDGEVAEGDAATFEVTETPEMVYVVFDGRELLDREEFDDDGEREHAIPA
jgi:hypothetical protein